MHLAGCAFSRESHYLLSGSGDGRVKLWSVRHSQCLVTYRDHGFPVWDVAFSPHNAHFLSSCYDGAVRVFSTERYDLSIENTVRGALAPLAVVSRLIRCSMHAVLSCLEQANTQRFSCLHSGLAVRPISVLFLYRQDSAASSDDRSPLRCDSCALPPKRRIHSVCVCG